MTIQQRKYKQLVLEAKEKEAKEALGGMDLSGRRYARQLDDWEIEKDNIGDLQNSTIDDLTYLNSHNLSCFYTNADVLRNKMDELNSRIKDENDDIYIIGVVGTKCKNPNKLCEMCEYTCTVDGYDLFSNDHECKTNRGVILYVKKVFPF